VKRADLTAGCGGSKPSAEARERNFRSQDQPLMRDLVQRAGWVDVSLRSRSLVDARRRSWKRPAAEPSRQVLSAGPAAPAHPVGWSGQGWGEQRLIAVLVMANDDIAKIASAKIPSGLPFLRHDRRRCARPVRGNGGKCEAVAGRRSARWWSTSPTRLAGCAKVQRGQMHPPRCSVEQILSCCR
jgi:hypothetical protein